MPPKAQPLAVDVQRDGKAAESQLDTSDSTLLLAYGSFKVG